MEEIYELKRAGEIFTGEETEDDLRAISDSKALFGYIKDDTARFLLVKKAHENFCRANEVGNTPAYLYKKEVEFLAGLPNDKVKRLYFALFCVKRLHYHQSGWIRFERSEISRFAGLDRVREDDMSDLVDFGFDMRVSGSKKAVSTFLDPDIAVYDYSAQLYDDEIAYRFYLSECDSVRCRIFGTGENDASTE